MAQWVERKRTLMFSYCDEMKKSTGAVAYVANKAKPRAFENEGIYLHPTEFAKCAGWIAKWPPYLEGKAIPINVDEKN